MIYLYRIPLLLLTFLIGHACRNSPAVHRPNVLLIMTDQHPRSCVGAYSKVPGQTAHLDALAESGHVLNNFYIAAFACSPSRASILSGRFLHNHNVFTNNVKFDASIPSLGKILSDAGYRTGYFGKAHLGGYMYVGRQGGDGVDYLHDSTTAKDPLGEQIKDYWYYERKETAGGWLASRKEGGPGEDQPQLGFNTWRGGWKDYKNWLLEQGKPEFAVTAGNHDALQSAPEGQHMYSLLGEEYHMATYFTNELMAFIEAAEDDRPWGAVLSYFGPHLPVSPPQPWDTLFTIDEVSLPRNLHDSLSNKPMIQHKPELQYVLGQWSDEQFKDYIRRYWGYSAFIDDRVGQIFELLRSKDQWDNTIVIFTTDHGDMVSGHGMIFKLGGNAYDELFRVPAIVKLPGINSVNRTTDALISSVDLLPTILDAAQVDIPTGVDGRSLVPLLKGEETSHHPAVFAEIHGMGPGKVIMCRDQRYKYIYHWLSDDVDELYDLKLDPGELQNLYLQQEYQSVVSEMRDKILQWSKEYGHKYANLIAQKASQ